MDATTITQTKFKNIVNSTIEKYNRILDVLARNN